MLAKVVTGQAPIENIINQQVQMLGIDPAVAAETIAAGFRLQQEAPSKLRKIGILEGHITTLTFQMVGQTKEQMNATAAKIRTYIKQIEALKVPLQGATREVLDKYERLFLQAPALQANMQNLQSRKDAKDLAFMIVNSILGNQSNAFIEEVIAAARLENGTASMDEQKFMAAMQKERARVKGSTGHRPGQS